MSKNKSFKIGDSISLDDLSNAFIEEGVEGTIRAADIRLRLLFSENVKYLTALGHPIGGAEYEATLNNDQTIRITKKKATEVLEAEKEECQATIDRLRLYFRELQKMPTEAPQTEVEPEPEDVTPPKDLGDVVNKIKVPASETLADDVIDLAIAFGYEVPKVKQIAACVKEQVKEPGTILLYLEKKGIIKRLP